MGDHRRNGTSIQRFFSEQETREDGWTQVRRTGSIEDILDCGRSYEDQLLDIADLLNKNDIVQWSDRVCLWGGLNRSLTSVRAVRDVAASIGHTIHFHVFRFCELEYLDGALQILVSSADADDPSHSDAFNDLFRFMLKVYEDRLEFNPVASLLDQTEEEEDEAHIEDEAQIEIFGMPTDALACLLRMADSSKKFQFRHLSFSPDQYRLLAAYRGGLDFEYCSLEDDGESIFENIGRDEGPNELHLSDMDIALVSFRENLRRTRSLRRAGIHSVGLRFADLLHFLGGNRSLRWFAFTLNMTDDEFGALMESLKTHPTVETVGILGSDFNMGGPARVTRANAVVDMLKVNTTIHHMWYLDAFADTQIVAKEIQPRLDLNLLRPRLAALMNEKPDIVLQLASPVLAGPKLNSSPSLMYLALSSMRQLLAETEDRQRHDEVRSSAGRSRELRPRKAKKAKRC